MDDEKTGLVIIGWKRAENGSARARDGVNPVTDRRLKDLMRMHIIGREPAIRLKNSKCTLAEAVSFP